MMVLDYLIANEDRHFNNFGLLRNPDTLEWLGPAPIYDSGSSLGYDKLTPQIRSGRNIICKPFKRTHQDQLRLVTSFDWLDFSNLNDVDQDIREVFAGAEEFIDKERVEAIIASVNQRIQMLEDFRPHTSSHRKIPLKTMWSEMWRRNMGWAATLKSATTHFIYDTIKV